MKKWEVKFSDGSIKTYIAKSICELMLNIAFERKHVYVRNIKEAMI